MSTPPASILVVDDEPSIVRSLELCFEEDFPVLGATSGEQALSVLAEHPEVGVIVSDQRMPGMTGVELLARSIETHPLAVRIVLTGYTDVESLIDAINTGHVFQYVTKPWENHDIRMVVGRAMEHHRLTLENARLTGELREANERLSVENVELKRQVGTASRFDSIIGSSEPMQELFTLMGKLARTDATVLIQGETGTGKELIARALHYNGPRAAKPMVTQNCAALTETLLESELFGHKRGAFTGATEDRKGLFEIADGGTVFLDEIGETSAAVQVRLLRVLQEGEIKPVGSNRSRQVDVRVISATNRDLEEEVEAGRFREDLFYRLNVFTLDVPPLRSRRQDVPELTKHFVRAHADKQGIAPPEIASEALERLLRYDFPGNIRELQNEIERAVTLVADGAALTPDLFSPRLRGADEQPLPPPTGTLAAGSLAEQVDAFKRSLIEQAVQEHGSKMRAAEALGIPRQSLQKMMKRLDME